MKKVSKFIVLHPQMQFKTLLCKDKVRYKEDPSSSLGLCSFNLELGKLLFLKVKWNIWSKDIVLYQCVVQKTAS